jgi:cell division initiation protein
MISAQESAEKAVGDSRKEAEMMRKEAEIRAEEIIAQARKSSAELQSEIDALKAEKISLTTRLKHLLKSELELIEVLEKDQ